jgi:hypothetical protein
VGVFLMIVYSFIQRPADATKPNPDAVEGSSAKP